MADSRAATITKIDAWFVDEGRLYDGTDGIVDGTWNHSQLKGLIRMLDGQGAKLLLTSGVLTIIPSPSDTSSG